MQGGVLDAAKCLSCQTIENRDPELPEWVAQRIGHRLYGCDECQRACPHNRHAIAGRHPEFEARESILSLTAEQVLAMDQTQFSATFRHSAIKRTKLAGLHRNARLITHPQSPNFLTEDCPPVHIASSLEGTWEGYTHMQSYYNGRYYNSTYSYVDFTTDPFSFTSGYGHWVDYYSNAPWDYIANNIEWHVRNGDDDDWQQLPAPDAGCSPDAGAAAGSGTGAGTWYAPITQVISVTSIIREI